MTAQRVRNARTAATSASRGRRGTVVGVSLFIAFVAGIVAWIVIGTTSSGADEASAPAAGTSHSTAPAAPTSAAEPTEAAPAPAPSATSTAATPTTAAATIEIPPGATAESVFLDVVADSGMAPPATTEEQLAMARDACAALDGGMTHEQLGQAFMDSGATAAEAENFIRLATATICPQHAGA
jgi:cytoskeletal protein RodZ